MPAPQVYTSLQTAGRNQLRLVTLLPSPTQDATIQCTLSIRSLKDQSLAYEALSYEWGDPNSSQHEILLDGQPFNVRRNLWQALRSLRTELSARTLWIDAICINQEDFAERNHQVAMMGNIYNFASSVRVWLGEKGENSREAFLLLHEIWESFEEVSRPSTEGYEKAQALRKKLVERNAVPPTPSGRFDALDKLSIPPLQIQKGETFEASRDLLVQERRVAWWNRLAVPSEPLSPWQGVAALVERTYWSRIWIVQEYLLASQTVIQCGRDYIDGTRFDEAVSLVGDLFDRRKDNDPKPLPEILRCLSRVASSPGIKLPRSRISDHERTLMELMETCKSSKSCDPHDRIYAILGLASDVPPEAILVDYERSIFKVKMDVAWWYSTRSRLKSHPASVSRVCSVLDEIFADYADGD
ncbi:HET domain containing protein [Hyaloscypha variabilis]